MEQDKGIEDGSNQTKNDFVSAAEQQEGLFIKFIYLRTI